MIYISSTSAQFGPQQLKYMTVLRDSSDCFAFLSLKLPETIAEEDGEGSFLAWETDLRWFLADLIIVWFHLQNPWSFSASTTPILAATTQPLLPELIISSSTNSLFFDLLNQAEYRNVFGGVKVVEGFLIYR